MGAGRGHLSPRFCGLFGGRGRLGRKDGKRRLEGRLAVHLDNFSRLLERIRPAASFRYAAQDNSISFGRQFPSFVAQSQHIDRSGDAVYSNFNALFLLGVDRIGLHPAADGRNIGGIGHHLQSRSRLAELPPVGNGRRIAQQQAVSLLHIGILRGESHPSSVGRGLYRDGIHRSIDDLTRELLRSFGCTSRRPDEHSSECGETKFPHILQAFNAFFDGCIRRWTWRLYGRRPWPG